MINNVIFDFGKVIVDFDPEKILKPFISNKRDREKLIPILFDRKYWDKLDTGEITEDDVFNVVSKEIGDGLCSGVKDALSKWYYDLPIYYRTVDIIHSLKKQGRRVFLLSNISRKFAENYNNIGYLKDIFSEFDGLVFSGAEGIVKPQKEIFMLVLERYNLNPKETLFVDDRAVNLKAAKDLGIKTFLFSENYNELAESLELK